MQWLELQYVRTEADCCSEDMYPGSLSHRVDTDALFGSDLSVEASGDPVS